MIDGDINNHLESYDNYIAKLTDYKGGRIKQIHLVSDLEGELRLDISPKFALSIGTGYIAGKNKSEFETTGPPQSPFGYQHKFSFEPKIKIIPLKLGIYYTLPLRFGINLFLNGGLGYYFSKAYLLKYHMLLYGGWGEDYDEYDVSSNGLGVYGGIGFERNIGKSFALVLEFQGRYARIKNLKGKRSYYPAWQPPIEEEGILYVGERHLTNYGYDRYRPELIISPSRPSGDEFRNIREAVLDLSGFSLRAGIRIRLF